MNLPGNKPIIALLLTLVLVFIGLTGCSAASPDKTVTDFLDAVKQGDFETALQYVETEADQPIISLDSPEEEKLGKLIFSKLSYKIVSTSKDNDTASVQTEITSPDLLRIVTQAMGDLFALAFTNAFSQDTNNQDMDKIAEQYFEDSLSDPNVPMATNVVEFTLKKQDKTWIIVPDDDLINALMGNIGEAFEAFEQQE